MNIPTIIVLALILLGVYYALRTLRKNDGHPCSGCRDCSSCPHCKEKE